MKVFLVLVFLFFAAFDAKAACLTIFENPDGISDICRKQITNYFRYHRGWAKDSCNGIYSYKITASNVVELKYTENNCDARLALRVLEERNFCFVQALAPFPNTAACGKLF